MGKRAVMAPCGWRVCWWLLVFSLPSQADLSQLPRLRIIGAEAGLPSSDIVGLGQDRTGDIWIATKDGLARYDGIDMTLWRHDPADPASLPENRLQVLHMGLDGRIWVGGVSQGAAVLDPASGTLTRYGAGRFALMRSNSILSIATQADAVWLGTMDGLYRIQSGEKMTGWWHVADDPESLPGTMVLQLAFDPDGVLWVATTAGLARIDPDGRVHRVPIPGTTPSPLIYSLVSDGGQLWVGTPEGVVVRRGDGTWEWPAWSARFARPNAMLDLAVDPAGDRWLGSQRGVWRVSPEGMAAPVRPTVDPVGMRVFNVLVQSNGAVWIPVYGQGLGYLRSDWRRVRQFARGTSDLSGDHYGAITPAREGGHWLLARNGAVERVTRDGVAERLEARVLEALKDERLAALTVDAEGAFWMAGANVVINAGGMTRCAMRHFQAPICGSWPGRMGASGSTMPSPGCRCAMPAPARCCAIFWRVRTIWPDFIQAIWSRWKSGQRAPCGWRAWMDWCRSALSTASPGNLDCVVHGYWRLDLMDRMCCGYSARTSWSVSSGARADGCGVNALAWPKACR